MRARSKQLRLQLDAILEAEWRRGSTIVPLLPEARRELMRAALAALAGADGPKATPRQRVEAIVAALQATLLQLAPAWAVEEQDFHSLAAKLVQLWAVVPRSLKHGQVGSGGRGRSRRPS